MKPFIEQRMFTTTEQMATIQQNDSQDGIVLCTQEMESKSSGSRLYLTSEEAIELSTMLLSMVDKLKKSNI
jgi:hypothetical protein